MTVHETLTGVECTVTVIRLAELVISVTVHETLTGVECTVTVIERLAGGL